MSIDAGGACSDRTQYNATNFTIVGKDNPSNDAGTIDTVCVWAYSEVSGLEYAAFSASGNDLTTNGDTNGSNLSASGETTHTAPGDFTAFNINSGEYIGCYCSSGQVEKDLSGAAGMWYLKNDNIPCTGATFGALAGDIISLYATGTAAAAELSIPIAMYHYLHH